MEISGENTKYMTNNNNCMTKDVQIAENTIDEVHRFKYLGTIIIEEGSKLEVLDRIAQATAALASLKIVLRDITPRSKIRLMHSLVISIFLYSFNAEYKRRRCSHYYF